MLAMISGIRVQLDRRVLTLDQWTTLTSSKVSLNCQGAVASHFCGWQMLAINGHKVCIAIILATFTIS